LLSVARTIVSCDESGAVLLWRFNLVRAPSLRFSKLGQCSNAVRTCTLEGDYIVVGTAAGEVVAFPLPVTDQE